MNGTAEVGLPEQPPALAPRGWMLRGASRRSECSAAVVGDDVDVDGRRFWRKSVYGGQIKKFVQTLHGRA